MTAAKDGVGSTRFLHRVRELGIHVGHVVDYVRLVGELACRRDRSGGEGGADCTDAERSGDARKPAPDAPRRDAGRIRCTDERGHHAPGADSRDGGLQAGRHVEEAPQAGVSTLCHRRHHCGPRKGAAGQRPRHSSAGVRDQQSGCDGDPHRQRKHRERLVRHRKHRMGALAGRAWQSPAERAVGGSQQMA
jgi:hypothetical protein